MSGKADLHYLCPLLSDPMHTNKGIVNNIYGRNWRSSGSRASRSDHHGAGGGIASSRMVSSCLAIYRYGVEQIMYDPVNPVIAVLLHW